MADNQFINFNSQDVADMYRRNQYARMLQEQAAAPTEPYSYKGIQAPIQPTQIAAKMAAALLAGHQQNQMDERYTNEKAAAEQKLVAEQERRRGEVADYQKGFEPTLSYGPSGGAGDYGTPPTISTPRSRGEILAQALRGAGSDNPQVANIGRMQYEQQNTMAQDQARAAEKAATEATRVKERDEDIKIRADDRKAAREDAQRNKQPTAPAGYRFTPNGDLMQIPGGPADVKSNAPSQKERVEKNLQETAKDNVEATLKRMDANYKALRDIGGMRTQTGNPLSNLASAVGSSLPYAAQGKKESLLRESLDSDLQSLVMPAMKASGMTSKQMDTPAEVARYMRTLGGTNISYEGNQPILERLHTELVGRPNNPFNKDKNINSVLDKYAPKGK